MTGRGGFGSPTLFVNGGDMYFGNNRLPLVRTALLRGGRSRGAGNSRFVPAAGARES